jgi:ABC-type nitrate/sulfonate/bicarbonate transport system substrate-binding protein
MKIDRRAFLGVGAAGLAAGGLGLPLRSRAAAEAGPAGELPLALAVLRNVPGSLIVVANGEQAFRKSGVALTIPAKFLSGGGPELLPAVAAGKVDVGVIGDSPVILAMGRDSMPLSVVSVVSENSRVFSILTGPEIGSVPELAGKSIGLPLGTAFEYFLARCLGKFGMKLSDVKLVNLNQAQAQPAFVAKRIDATLPDTFGRAALLKARPDAKVLFDSDKGFVTGPGSTSPFYEFNIFVAAKDIVSSRRPAIQRFLHTYYEAVTPLLARPSDATVTITKMAAVLNGPTKGAIKEEDLATQVKLSVFPTLDQARRMQKEELLAALDAQAEFWIQTGRIKAKPDFKPMLDAIVLA